MSGYAKSVQEPRNDVPCRYISTPPLTKWTFEDRQIREWAESHLEGRVLNACCGKSVLEHDGEVFRNDLDETLDADLHVDVAALPIHLQPASFDTVVFDPPWTVYQSNLVYEGRHVRRGQTDIDLQDLPFHVDIRGKDIVGHARLAKEGFDYLLRDGGKVLQLTAHGTCMPSRLGYERVERVVFDPYGEAKAVIGSVDRRTQSKLGFTEAIDKRGDGA